MSLKTLENAVKRMTYTDFDFVGERPNRELVEVKKSVADSVFTDRETGNPALTSERGCGLIDYYGEYRGGYPYVSEKLEKLVKKHGCYYEWIHPGAICFYQ